ncbi:hypothetical protein ER308_01295 [Egibacter rhizosphaerae]|uniref:Uncharacterized protein n=1 Tax=Egibacter rhizosphaerae TaxID=1670831 RepID=A0A411YAY3_9ACTN|nr:hypothetical protein [Egibacter rhizosphaerae]QBI18339.1 hypothetical protein ER308_01295 [Egibacter rhizosphaerae]
MLETVRSHERVSSELLTVLAEPGCPICTGIARVAHAEATRLLGESVTDPGTRERWRAARGPCRDHARTLLAAAERANEGHAVARLYVDLVPSVQQRLAREASRPNLPGRGRRQRAGLARCPLCGVTEVWARRALHALAAATPKGELDRAARVEGREICAPHLAFGIRSVPRRRERVRLAELGELAAQRHREALDGLIDELRGGSPPRPHVLAAWRGAVEWLAGLATSRGGRGRTSTDT